MRKEKRFLPTLPKLSPHLGPRSNAGIAGLFTAGVAGFWCEARDLTTLFQDSAGVTPVTAVGQPVGRMLDKSGNGNHALQATSAARPTYARMPLGGRRNLLIPSGDLTAAAWEKVGTATASSATVGNFPAVSDSIASGAATIATIGTTATGSATLSGTGTIRMRVTRLVGGGVFEMTTSLITLTDTPTRYSVSHTIVNASQIGFTLMFIRGASETATTVTIQNSQLELGATATACQLVVSLFDVTEAGKPDRFAVLDDLVDDAMTVTLPAGTYTVASADDAGVTILTGQALSGAYTIPSPQRLYGVVSLNRALTSPETTALTAWLNERRP